MIFLIAALVRLLINGRESIVMENAALRHQLAVLQRSPQRPKLKPKDRRFWALLCRVWSGWKNSLVLVQPETVLRWHKAAFRLYWRRKSDPRLGRPKAPAEIRQLIRQMSLANRLLSLPKIPSGLFLGVLDLRQILPNRGLSVAKSREMVDRSDHFVVGVTADHMN